MSTLSDLATQIYDSELCFTESASERAAELVLIETWLEAHIGELNTLINTNFEITDLSLVLQEEQSILREMYLLQYYRRQSRNVLRLVDGSQGELDFHTIREGDSVITRTNKSEIAKNYRSLISQTQQKINGLVSSYNMYAAKPSQISGDDAPV
jgi:hypothetical protein